MSMWRLPEEIEVDIFLKLPVNSILACRCVCKPWCGLLTKPKFIKDHLDLTIQSNNNNNPRLMFGQSQYDQGKNPIINSVDYKSISSSSSSSASDFPEMKVVSMEYPFEKINTKAIVFLGSCTGLICLGVSNNGTSINEKNWICIWNPSTGEYIDIKLHILEFREKASYCYRYGFGYGSNIDDYKLVQISGYDNCWSQIVKVCTIGSKCWKTIQSKHPYVFSGQLHENLHGVFINGVLHWSGATKATFGITGKHIVCFDINEERFMDIPFPEETVLPLQQHQETYREVGGSPKDLLYPRIQPFK
ncbi:hypothetical protein C5167_048173 [Papaver somniferum]|uniref:F-box domain-containing protein n=1 Tax=Papaver somniferum TaxID=3469 RepID=A0A4Y7KH78_PAPSO|nr:hypothetical protein C5167_048173 [Papaver somniferum]